ncbi:MAG TPA: SDR family NAD(P)-dependent oxidoreductase [Thermopolyspora sp.]
MSTIAIVGTASTLNLAIAQVFGDKGFNVALVSPSQAKPDDLADRLNADGIPAGGFTADILDRPAVETAFAAINKRFGEIEVLEFSPASGAGDPGNADALHLTMESLRPRLAFFVGGAISVVNQVLPSMLARDSGTMIFTTGMSSVRPPAMPADVGIAGAALRNWAHSLNVALADTNVHSAHVAIGVGTADADVSSIAPLYWDIYTQRDQVELLFT